MRGNAWQVTAIIAIILVIILIVPLVIMGKNHSDLAQTTQKAMDDQKAAAQKAATLEGENKTLKTLIGGADATTMDELRKQHAALMETALPGEDDSTRSYNNAVTALLESLEKEKDAHGTTSLNYAQVQSDLSHERAKYKEATDKISEEKKRVEAELSALDIQFRKVKKDLEDRVAGAEKKQEETLAKSERDRYELNEQVVLLTNDNRDLRERNASNSEMLEDIRNPNLEYPAGKILSVEQQAGRAIVNLGSEDGLMIRTMFSVYPSSVSGIAFRSAPAGREAIYCDACKRDIARDTAKAGVEVMRILGPHRAEVRILDDILTDPIMAGDVIYSPIWKPGQRLRFALTAGMHLPGSSVDSGVKGVKQMIEMMGGVVDCWIDETKIEGDDSLIGSISDLTNYIVVSENATHNLDKEVARVQQGLIESAKNRAVKTISLEDLLNRMNWKNMTPVYEFGSGIFTPEMRVVPQHQGTFRPSSGTVSPTFTPDNASARVNARSANPARAATNAVSPLFDRGAPPAATTGGATSNLFRPRSPAAGETKE
ncbi:MAG: hypothetical protein LBI05_11665 [Planctomycetaceae bacterium]|jgi:hypothetical protein|nr:hypothetical protein [Planctomycetaceae bacterium]